MFMNVKEPSASASSYATKSHVSRSELHRYSSTYPSTSSPDGAVSFPLIVPVPEATAGATRPVSISATVVTAVSAPRAHLLLDILIPPIERRFADRTENRTRFGPPCPVFTRRGGAL